MHQFFWNYVSCIGWAKLGLVLYLMFLNIWWGDRYSSYKHKNKYKIVLWQVTHKREEQVLFILGIEEFNQVREKSRKLSQERISERLSKGYRCFFARRKGEEHYPRKCHLLRSRLWLISLSFFPLCLKLLSYTRFSTFTWFKTDSPEKSSLALFLSYE